LKNTEYNPDKEYASRIQEALTYYGLEAGDLGKLVGTNATDINDIINLKRKLGINRANKISSVFGLKYFQFANAEVKFVPQEKLPKITINIINERKEKGPSNIEIDTSLDLPINTIRILKNLNVDSEFTPNSIHEKLPDEIKSKVTPNRITVLFKTGSLKKYVENTHKKSGNRHLYKFISLDRKNQMEKVLDDHELNNQS